MIESKEYKADKRYLRALARKLAQVATTQLQRDAAKFGLNSTDAILARPAEHAAFYALCRKAGV